MSQQIIHWMADTSLAHFMGDVPWAWPVAEAFHFVGMALLFGAVLVMDVRLLGYFRREISLHAIHALTPWALSGFVINLLTGLCFVFKDAERYQANPDFKLKIGFILLAGLNFLVFWFVIRGKTGQLSDDANTPASAKLVGASSIALWVLVIWTGRLMPVYGPG